MNCLHIKPNLRERRGPTEMLLRTAGIPLRSRNKSRHHSVVVNMPGIDDVTLGIQPVGVELGESPFIRCTAITSSQDFERGR